MPGRGWESPGIMVRKGGLEPPPLAGLDPKSSASTNSATLAVYRATSYKEYRVVASISCTQNCEARSQPYSALRDAMSIEKRYFTSEQSIRSYASLIFWIGITSTSAVILCSPQKSSIS